MRCFILALLTVVPCLTAGAASGSPLETLRDAQDRPALEQAATALDSAAARNPNDANGFYQAAVAWSYAGEVALEVNDKKAAQKDAEAGVRDAEKAVALNPNTGEYYRILGTLCGQVIPANPLAGVLVYGKRAKESLEKALALDPKSSRAYLSHGVGFYYLPNNLGGGAENALSDLDKAIALDPRSAEAFLWKGVVLRRVHRDAEARQALAKSLQLNPGRAWARQQIEKIPANQ